MTFTKKEKLFATILAGLIGLGFIIPEKLEIPLNDEHVIGYEVTVRENGIIGHVWFGDETNPTHLHTNYTRGEQSTSISANTHQTEFDISTIRGARLSFSQGVATYEVHHSDPFGRLSTKEHDLQYMPRGKER